MSREGERDINTKPRRSRFELRNNDWYVQTREGWQLGPYPSHAEAAVSMDEYMDFMKTADAHTLERFYQFHAFKAQEHTTLH